MVRLWNYVINLALTAAIILAFVVLSSPLSSVLPFSWKEIMQILFYGVLPTYMAVYLTLSGSAVTNRISNKLRRVAQKPSRHAPFIGIDEDMEDDEGPSNLGEAVPLTESDREFERTQFRPYEVLYYMDRVSRENLFEDAKTQTFEMWKNRRTSDYEALRSYEGVDLDSFKPELLPDDEGRLDLNVVPVFPLVNSEEASERIDVLADEFANDFLSRIVKLARVHDEFEPNT